MLKLKPITRQVDTEAELWEYLLTIVQSILPASKRLTGTELKVFSYVLSQDAYKDQFRQPQRDKTAKALNMDVHTLAMHRTRIGKKGWIVDKLPEKFIRKVQLDSKAESEPLEVEFTIKLKVNNGRS